MGANDALQIEKTAAEEVRKILDKVMSGDVVGVAATLIYKDGSVLYVPIGCAPDPLAGLSSWVRTIREDRK